MFYISTLTHPTFTRPLAGGDDVVSGPWTRTTLETYFKETIATQGTSPWSVPSKSTLLLCSRRKMLKSTDHLASAARWERPAAAKQNRFGKENSALSSSKCVKPQARLSALLRYCQAAHPSRAESRIPFHIGFLVHWLLAAHTAHRLPRR